MKSGRIGLQSNTAQQHQHDDDDQDSAKNTGPGMSEPITIATKAATETAEQKNDENDEKDRTE